MPLTVREATGIQERLRDRVIGRGSVRPRTVAAVDVSEKDGQARAALVLTRNLEPVEEIAVEEPLRFPYIPGLLSFREIPAILSAWKKLKKRPDVVLVDGQGYAHPRRFGLACHLGILIDVPTIGCAKSRLMGEHREPAPERGAWTALWDGDERIGAALRTRQGVRPLYVSIGHRVSLGTAIRVVLQCSLRYRVPEPLRLADRLSKLSR